jgi:hypothetical protein
MDVLLLLVFAGSALIATVIATWVVAALVVATLAGES